MIEIVVLSRQGAAVGQPMAARFGPEGGTIGRAETNTLVLNDPERTVSRVHAQVLCRDGQYVVIDRGSNPMQSNGRPLGAGNEAPLAPEDRLIVGGFELCVKAVQSASSTVSASPVAAPRAASSADDPFADLLEGLAPSPALAVPASVAKPKAASAADAMFPDPMAASGRGGATAAVDPFADLLGASPSAPMNSAGGGGGLDDFSDLGLSASPPGMGAQKIDALFGGMGGGMGGDPLALSPLADPLLQPNTAGAADPLAALQRVAGAPAAPVRSDHAPMGSMGYVPPREQKSVSPVPAAGDASVRISSSNRAPVVAPQARLPEDLDPLAGLLGSVDDALDGLLAPSAAPVAAPAPTPRPQSLAPIAPNVGNAAGAARPASPAAPMPPAAPPAHAAAPAYASMTGAAVGADELLAAFLHGLGPQHQPPQSLTPALMERIGVMLRCATEGTLQLLVARHEFKREVRADVTVIASQANNPLKFSPTVEVALTHLLGPGIRGFMPAEAAMGDAYRDLRSHQFGVMVGMRAALEQLIARFAPDQLEKKIAAKSALDNLFAAGRKAKLWDQFVALYGTIATEAEDDFHALFGKAFLAAYEEQMARLEEQAQDGG